MFSNLNCVWCLENGVRNHSFYMPWISVLRTVRVLLVLEICYGFDEVLRKQSTRLGVVIDKVYILASWHALIIRPSQLITSERGGTKITNYMCIDCTCCCIAQQRKIDHIKIQFTSSAGKLAELNILT